MEIRVLEVRIVPSSVILFMREFSFANRIPVKILVSCHKLLSTRAPIRVPGPDARRGPGPPQRRARPSRARRDPPQRLVHVTRGSGGDQQASTLEDCYLIPMVGPLFRAVVSGTGAMFLLTAGLCLLPPPSSPPLLPGTCSTWPRWTCLASLGPNTDT